SLLRRVDVRPRAGRFEIGLRGPRRADGALGHRPHRLPGLHRPPRALRGDRVASPRIPPRPEEGSGAAVAPGPVALRRALGARPPALPPPVDLERAGDGLPLPVRAENLTRPIARLVGHSPRAGDEVAEVKVRQAPSPALVDQEEDVEDPERAR